ncbi:c-type cytochrome domain-containing protein, partial [Singulisphaera rosea]
MRRSSSFLLVVGFLSGGLHAAEATLPAAQVEFFEKQIRPVLVERCQSCHGPEKQKGGLRLDSRAALLAGGDSG